jgi:hypothetical protein
VVTVKTFLEKLVEKGEVADTRGVQLKKEGTDEVVMYMRISALLDSGSEVLGKEYGSLAEEKDILTVYFKA